MILILYQDETFIIVSKPSGLLVHNSGIDAKESNNLCQKILQDYKIECHPISRLDKATSGLIVLVKTDKRLSKQAKLLQQISIKKQYIALVRGRAASGLLIKDIQEEKTKAFKTAITKFKTIKTFKSSLDNKRHKNIELSLLQIEIQNGRYHQIRKHLASINHPILGDTSHGDNILNRSLLKKTNTTRRLMLHSYKIAFFHLQKQAEVCVKAKITKDFLSLYKSIRKHL